MDIGAALPWPVGLLLGIIAFFGIRYGTCAYLSSAPTGMFDKLALPFPKLLHRFPGSP